MSNVAHKPGPYTQRYAHHTRYAEGDIVCLIGRAETYVVERVIPAILHLATDGEHVVMVRTTERGVIERISIDITLIDHLAEE